MPNQYDPNFAGYATRVAFDVRLTRVQIHYLCLVKANQGNAYSTIKGGRGGLYQPDNWITSYRALESRGLIEYNKAHHLNDHPDYIEGPKDWVRRLTPAGELVFGLLQIAGLAVLFGADNDRDTNAAVAATITKEQANG